MGNIIYYKMTLDFWALLFYSVKSIELVIICGFVKIEEDQLLCIRGEERHERKTLPMRVISCCAYSGKRVEWQRPMQEIWQRMLCIFRE